MRATGTAEVVSKASAGADLMAAFEADWSLYLDHMSGFIDIRLTADELILSPGYDLGFTEDELKAQNLEKLNAL